MRGHVFVDETKRRDYLLVAARLQSQDLDAARRTPARFGAARSAAAAHERRTRPRKQAIAAAIADSGVQATVYDAGRRHRFTDATALDRRQRRRAYRLKS